MDLDPVKSRLLAAALAAILASGCGATRLAAGPPPTIPEPPAPGKSRVTFESLTDLEGYALTVQAGKERVTCNTPCVADVRPGPVAFLATAEGSVVHRLDIPEGTTRVRLDAERSFAGKAITFLLMSAAGSAYAYSRMSDPGFMESEEDQALLLDILAIEAAAVGVGCFIPGLVYLGSGNDEEIEVTR